MSVTIWTSEIANTKYRIVQRDPADCIVQYAVHPGAEGEPNWWTVEDDAIVAEIYMTAYLQLRGTLAQVQALINR